MSTFADAIEAIKDLGGALSFPTLALIEEAHQTFTYGVPVMVDSSDGGVKIWDGSTLTAGIAGFSLGPASNLGSTGLGAPQGFTPILGNGSVIGSYAANPYQPLAVITPPMVPMSDGTIAFAIAGAPTVFIGVIGSSSGSDNPVATANAQVGVAYGLTLESASGFWYVDTNKTSGSAAVRITELDPRQPVGTVGGHVLFTVLAATAQINP